MQMALPIEMASSIKWTASACQEIGLSARPYKHQQPHEVYSPSISITTKLFDYCFPPARSYSLNMSRSKSAKGGLVAMLMHALSLSLTAAGPLPQDPAPDPAGIKKPQKYMAFGDSFAAGIGAGSEFGAVHLDACHRYDGGYPSQLHALAYGGRIPEENLKACTGAKADQVKEQAKDLDETADLVCLQLGSIEYIWLYALLILMP